jgi:hypothetical protein
MKSRFYRGLKTNEEKRLFDSIKEVLTSSEFKLKIKRIKDGANDDENWLGYFSEEKKEIVVFYREGDEHEAILVLAHEYSHFIQSCLNTPAWSAFEESYNNCPILNFVLKSSKEDGDIREKLMKKFNIANKKILKDFVLSLISMEKECEQLSLVILDHFKIKYNKSEYLAEVKDSEKRMKNFLKFGYYWD